jgi:hypothetical protein
VVVASTLVSSGVRLAGNDSAILANNIPSVQLCKSTRGRRGEAGREPARMAGIASVVIAGDA